MLAYVINRHGKPLMPCHPAKARLLLKQGKAKVIKRTPFTIQLIYGLFWCSLVFILAFKDLPGTPAAYIGWHFFMWGLFTFFMWFGTFGKNRAIQFVFLSLTILFWLLAIRDWTGSSGIGVLAGWEGIICGLSACYLAMAEVLNESRGRIVLPIGEIKK